MERGRHVWIEMDTTGLDSSLGIHYIGRKYFDSVILVFTAPALRRRRGLSVESLTDGRPSTLLVFTSTS